ncbi:hypothetical protein FAM23169_02701 [Lentilactobacillus parabuchneri]|uniref:Uncharacterized protein n=1 Tax=Lentilactobacillus parabuchneri TaxID=152331 RepID=A0A1X1FAV7_9LACO|nr:hypothetical protein FAM23169_02701 [Lentilactobacillus parabuchneri]
MLKNGYSGDTNYNSKNNLKSGVAGIDDINTAAPDFRLFVSNYEAPSPMNLLISTEF